MPDYPPGYGPMPQAPGLFSSTMMASGIGGSPYGQSRQQRQMGTDVGAARAGGMAATAIGGGLISGGIGLASGTGYLLGAPLAEGARTAVGKGLGMAWRATDPFWMGGYGYSAGSGFGAGLAGGTGAMSTTMGLAGGAMGVGGVMLAIEGARAYGRNFATGAANRTTGTAMMRGMGSSYSGAGVRSHGASFGKEMASTAREMGSSVEEIANLTRELKRLDAFSTTSSLKEFRNQFKKTMDTVKEIAQTTQSSVGEATQTFAQLKGQGFYKSGDLKSQSLAVAGTAGATGLSRQRVLAMQDYGAQVARSRGLRGKVGAEVGRSMISGVGGLMRSDPGAEELIMEMGGIDQVSANMTSKVIGFAGTSEGRAMIAASMGQGGTVSGSRLNALGSGNVKNLVQQATAGGLNPLIGAGGRKAKSSFLEYEGVPMLQMAIMQQRELGRDPTMKGTIGMLRSQRGMSQDEAELFIKMQVGKKDQLVSEMGSRATSATMGAYEEYRRTNSVIGRAKEGLNDLYSGARDRGSVVSGSVARDYSNTVNYLTGYRETRGGLEEEARLRSRMRGPVEMAPQGMNEARASALGAMKVYGSDRMDAITGAAGAELDTDQMLRLRHTQRMGNLPSSSNFTSGSQRSGGFKAIEKTLDIGNRIGLFGSGGMKIDAFMKLPEQKRMEHQQAIAKGLVNIGEKRLSEDLGGALEDASGLRVKMRDDAMANLDEKSDQLAWDLFGNVERSSTFEKFAPNFLTLLGRRNNRGMAKNLLRGGGEDAKAFEEITLRLLGATDIGDRERILLEAREDLGEDVYDALGQLSSDIDGMSDKERLAFRDSMKQKGLGGVSLDRQDVKSAIEQSRVESSGAGAVLKRGGKFADRYKSQLEGVRNARLSEGFDPSSAKNRQGKTVGILRDLVKRQGGDKMDIMPDEAAFFGEVYGTGGSGLLATVDAIASTDTDKLEGYLKTKGITGAKAKAIMSSMGANPGSKDAAIMALASQNLISAEQWSMDATGTSVTGVEMEKQVLLAQKELVGAITVLLESNTWLKP